MRVHGGNGKKGGVHGGHGKFVEKISVLLKVVFQFRSLFVDFCGSLCLLALTVKIA